MLHRIITFSILVLLSCNLHAMEDSSAAAAAGLSSSSSVAAVPSSFSRTELHEPRYLACDIRDQKGECSVILKTVHTWQNHRQYKHGKSPEQCYAGECKGAWRHNTRDLLLHLQRDHAFPLEKSKAEYQAYKSVSASVAALLPRTVAAASRVRPVASAARMITRTNSPTGLAANATSDAQHLNRLQVQRAENMQSSTPIEHAASSSSASDSRLSFMQALGKHVQTSDMTLTFRCNKKRRRDDQTDSSSSDDEQGSSERGKSFSSLKKQIIVQQELQQQKLELHIQKSELQAQKMDEKMEEILNRLSQGAASSNQSVPSTCVQSNVPQQCSSNFSLTSQLTSAQVAAQAFGLLLASGALPTMQLPQSQQASSSSSLPSSCSLPLRPPQAAASQVRSTVPASQSSTLPQASSSSSLSPARAMRPDSSSFAKASTFAKATVDTSEDRSSDTNQDFNQLFETR